MKRIIFITILVCLFVSNYSTYAVSNKNQFLWIKGNNRGELFKQPNGPFEVMIFDHDAQSCYMGIVYYKIQDNGAAHAIWKFSRCFWQEESWCADINSFAWSIDGKYLYVGTSGIYGNGRLWEVTK